MLVGERKDNKYRSLMPVHERKTAWKAFPSHSVLAFDSHNAANAKNFIYSMYNIA